MITEMRGFFCERPLDFTRPISVESCYSKTGSAKVILVSATAVFLCYLLSGLALGFWWVVGMRSLLTPEEYALFSVSLYFGAVLGSIFAANLISQYGRLGTLQISCFPCLLSWFCIHLTSSSLFRIDLSVNIVLTGRFLTGFSLGLSVVAGLIYLIEISPTSNCSGFFGSLLTLGLVCGTTLAQTVLINHNVRFYIVFVSCLVLLILNWWLLVLPESVKWIHKTEQFQAPPACFSFLSVPLQLPPGYQKLANDDSAQSHKRDAGDIRPDLVCCATWRPAMTDDERSRMRVLCCLMVLQQLTGVAALLNFSESVFQFGRSVWMALYAPVIGLPQIFFTAVTALWACRIPRKAMLHYSTVVMSLSYLLLGILLQFDELKPRSPYLILFIVLSLVGYSLGWGPLPIVMVGELTRVQHRGFVVSMAVAFGWICALVVLMLFEPLASLLTHSVYFVLLSFICPLCSLYVHLYVSETN